MRHSFARVVGGAVLAISFSLAVAADGDVARGRESYHAFGCWQCHGTTGAGGGWQGPKIAPTPIPFAAFVLQLRTPRGNMPHYPEQLLSDRDVADLYAFLSSIPSGRTADQIEIL
jgi:mono/diheme cytochrome c family protein